MPQPTLRERLRYRSDQFFQSGFTLQLFISSLIVVAVVLVFFIIVEVFQVTPGPDYGADPTGEGPYWPSVRLWWVITHILETYWLETGTFPQILATLLTLFNFLVFAAIIGLVGSRIQQRLEQLRRGTSRVVEEGHIVILGWSGKVVPIIRELQAGIENRKQVYVLHTGMQIDDVETRMRRTFGRGRRTRWVIRQGSMTDIKDLEVLSIERARVVVVLQRDEGSEQGDAQVVKSVMAAAHIIRDAAPDDRRKPQLIAEILHPSMARLARAAAGDVPISIVEPLEQLSKIILQTARQHGLVDVYREVFSHTGNEVHIAAAPQLEGRTWEEAVFSYRSAIPLGIYRDGMVRLLPASAAADFRLRKEDQIIALSRNEKGMRCADPELPATAPTPNGGTVPEAAPVRHVLLLGWNAKVLPLLKEYAAYARALGSSFSMKIVSPAIPDDISADVLQHASGSGHELAVTITREDYLREGVLEALLPSGFDAIIVLGDVWKDSLVEDPDTRVIMTLLLLRSQGTAPLPSGEAQEGMARTGSRKIVGEILNLSNKELAESTGTVRDVIISNDLVSRIIAQVSRDRRLEHVLRDLMDEEGAEIYFKHALRYVRDDAVVTFDQLLRASISKGEIAIGYCEDDPVSGERSVELNPDRRHRIRIHERLHLVVLADRE
ncbi:hypothetical protein KQI65_03170 [bacterium]|nr:hypothetical protein [bacterium]